MKFDRKYATIKEPKRSDLIVEETDESEPIINYEKSTPSPRDSHHGQSRLRRQAEQVINHTTYSKNNNLEKCAGMGLNVFHIKCIIGTNCH